MTKILITGANSFIGTNFISFSKFREIETISLRDLSPDSIDFKGTDVVLHLAALVHVGRNSKREDYFKINRDLCLEVAKCAKNEGVRQFVFMSSIKVFGRYITGSSPWNENSACNPDDYYGSSKYEAEVELQKLGDADFTVSIVRTPLVYGAGVKANMLLLMKLIRNFQLLPFAKIENRRHFTYVENLVGFIDKIIEKEAGGVFIAMDENSHSTTEIIYFIAEAMGRKIIQIKIPAYLIKALSILFPLFIERLYGSLELDNTQTKRILDFQPSFSTEAGIKKMVASFKTLP